MSTLIVKPNKKFISIVLNNPKYGNSFGFAEAEVIHKNKEILSNSKLPLVLTSAHGKNFCAGGNLSFYKSKNKEECIKANESITQAMSVLTNYQGVSLCVVEGNCFGGGMELISCFDNVVSSPSSFFGFWQRKVSLSFGWGGRERWKQRISESLLKRLCLSAQSLSSYKALQLGVIDKVLPSYQIQSYIDEWVALNNKLPQSPISAFKSKSDEQKIFKEIWFNSEHKEILGKD